MTIAASVVPIQSAVQHDEKRLLVIQALRLVAAVLVLASHAEIFAFHLGRFLGQPVDHRLFFLHGGFGVDLFFAISGFVIVISSARLPMRGARGAFLRRRMVRVAPLYWLATLLTAAWLARTGQAKPLREVLLSLLFIPHGTAPYGRIVPVLEVGWTLNFEMAFYLLFALALERNRPRTTAKRVAVMLLALVGLGAAAHLPMPTWAWARPILLEFLGGIAVAHAWQRGIRLPPWLRTAMLVAALALLTRFDPAGQATGPDRAATAGTAGLLVLAAAVLGPLALPWRRLWQTGGDISYALYLCHMPLMMVGQFIWRHFRWQYGPVQEVVFALACMAASLGAAIILHARLEKPMTAWLNRLLAPRSGPAGADQAEATAA